MLSTSAFANGVPVNEPKGQWFTSAGAVCNACKLYVYLSGTTTPTDSWPDATLTLGLENTNPVVLDSSGRAAIYVSSIAYKFVLKTSADVVIWTVDNWRDPGAQNAAAIATNTANIATLLAGSCHGRLTLTTGVAITTSDVTAATTLYFAPFNGSDCATYDSGAWVGHTFTQRSLSIAGYTADTNYDVWIYSNSGTLTLDTTAWTSATVRATALTTQDGATVKSGDATRRYVGSFRTTGTLGQTEDSLAKRFLSNALWPVAAPIKVLEATDTWTYTTATWRQANAATGNQVALLNANLERPMRLTVSAQSSNSNNGIVRYTAIGEDSTSSPMAAEVKGVTTEEDTGGVSPGQAVAVTEQIPPLGYHYYAWLEYSSVGGTSTWYGDNGAALLQSGMIGTWWH